MKQFRDMGSALIKGWLGDDNASVAVEFAQIAVPLVFLTIAIMELSMFFVAANMLEGGVSQSSRIIRTGQLQQQTDRPAEEMFREALCSNLYIVLNCDNVQIEVVAVPDDTFTGAGDLDPVYDEDGNFVPRDFDAGGSDSVVMVRAYYRYQLMTPLFADLFSRQPDNTIPLMTTVVLQTEPYDFNDEEGNT